MIDDRVPGSPGWWLMKLSKKLTDCRSKYELLDSYYRGDAVPPVMGSSNKQITDAYCRLMNMARMNYSELAVEAVRERMNPNGFNLNKGKDKSGSQKAWDIWQDNHLDADSMLVHRNMLSMGTSFVIVGQNDDDSILLTPEDAREVVVATDARNKRKAIAALKVFRDFDFDTSYAYLYLPGYIFVATSYLKDQAKYLNVDSGSWTIEDVIETNLDFVPVVPFVNNPDSYGKGWGEFERHLSLLDRINYTILERLEIATMQAFRQRGIKGVPDTDAEGNEIEYGDVFANAPGAMWLLPEGSDIWESQQTDLSGIRLSVKDDVQDFAAVTRTPLFYLTPEANNGSAEGASLAREGLVFKTKDRIRLTSESWEQVMRYAFAVSGDVKRSQANAMEVLWDDPERFTLGERFDAATKAQSAGVPWRTTMSTVLQYTPQQIDQMEAERAEDALQASALSAPPVAPGPTALAPAAQPAPVQPGSEAVTPDAIP